MRMSSGKDCCGNKYDKYVVVMERELIAENDIIIRVIARYYLSKKAFKASDNFPVEHNGTGFEYSNEGAPLFNHSQNDGTWGVLLGEYTTEGQFQTNGFDLKTCTVSVYADATDEYAVIIGKEAHTSTQWLWKVHTTTGTVLHQMKLEFTKGLLVTNNDYNSGTWQFHLNVPLNTNPLTPTVNTTTFNMLPQISLGKLYLMSADDYQYFQHSPLDVRKGDLRLWIEIDLFDYTVTHEFLYYDQSYNDYVPYFKGCMQVHDKDKILGVRFFTTTLNTTIEVVMGKLTYVDSVPKVTEQTIIETLTNVKNTTISTLLEIYWSQDVDGHQYYLSNKVQSVSGTLTWVTKQYIDGMFAETVGATAPDMYDYKFFIVPCQKGFIVIRTGYIGQVAFPNIPESDFITYRHKDHNNVLVSAKTWGRPHDTYAAWAPEWFMQVNDHYFKFNGWDGWYLDFSEQIQPDDIKIDSKYVYDTYVYVNEVNFGDKIYAWMINLKFGFFMPCVLTFNDDNALKLVYDQRTEYWNFGLPRKTDELNFIRICGLPDTYFGAND